MNKNRWPKKNKKEIDQGRRGRYTEEFRGKDTTTEQNVAFKSGSTLNTFRSTDREKSDRQKERNLRYWRRKMGGILIIIVTICALGIALLTQFSSSFNEISSNVPTMQPAEAAKYKTIVNEYLARNPFERFSFARRDDNLNNFLSEKAPEVKSVKIEQSGLLMGKLHFKLREPVAMWLTGDTTSYVDSEGAVFSKNYFAEPRVSINDNSGASAGGNTVVSSRFLSFVGQTTAAISAKGAGEVERVIIPAGAIRYVELYLVGRPYLFKAQIDRDPSSQAADIISIIGHLDRNNITPAYVDVRVPSKAYWK